MKTASKFRMFHVKVETESVSMYVPAVMVLIKITKT